MFVLFQAEAAAQAAANAPVWMKAKLGLSMQASRFTVPQDIRVLQRKYATMKQPNITKHHIIIILTILGLKCLL